jgi:hypothetical protein
MRKLKLRRRLTEAETAPERPPAVRYLKTGMRKSASPLKMQMTVTAVIALQEGNYPN